MTDESEVETPEAEESRGPALLLADLVRVFHGEELGSLDVKLMRHAFKHDRRILKELGVTEQEATGVIALKTADDKLAALRANPLLAEAFSAEQNGDKLMTDGRRARVVLQFAGIDGTSAEYLGAWEVGTELASRESYRERYQDFLVDLPSILAAKVGSSNCSVAGLGLSGLSTEASPKTVFYNLTRRPDVLPGMAGRLVVGWNAPKAWVSPVLAREVKEIRAAGFVRDFDDYDRLSLTWDELHMITSNPRGNPGWESRLNAVSGVYLITDLRTGALYVGSAYGSTGIWGRWKGYADPKAWHQGNEGLRRLHEKDPHHQRDFRFSLLSVVSRSVPDREVIALEGMWKERLGSRSILLGLNRN